MTATAADRAEPSSATAALRLSTVALPVALLLGLIMLNPRTYVGGGADDWYYMEAARCAARHGICLPDTHWAARFPLVLPLGAVLAMFGEGEWQAALVPLCYALAALLLLVANVGSRWGRGPALLAGSAFALTPISPLSALLPMVDMAELAWLLAGLLALRIADVRDDVRCAVLAGSLFAVAFMTRTTTAAVLPVLAIGLCLQPGRARRLGMPLAVAFAATLAVEGGAYAIATGDPLFGWKLSLRHAHIPSSELPAWVDLRASPILNPQFIANWRRSMGIHIHWTIDPLLNLLADPLCGLTLCGALALMLVRAADFRRDRCLALLGGSAVLHFLLLVFLLAIDPKPRMFLPQIAVACTAIGVLGSAAWRSGSRAIVVALFGLLAARGVVMSYDQPDMAAVRSLAADWIAAAPVGQLGTDEWTRRSLGLLPTARALPIAGSAPLRLRFGTEPCREGRVLREARFDRRESGLLGRMRARGILLRPQAPMRLCLMKSP